MQTKMVFAALAVAIASAAIFSTRIPSLPPSELVYQFQAEPPDIGEDLFVDLNIVKDWVTPCIHELVCSMLKKVQHDLPSYGKYLREGFRLAAGRKIDFVLFYHRTLFQMAHSGSIISGEDPVKIATQSAEMMSRVLLALKADIIGVEGCYTEKCSAEQEMEDAKRIMREFNIRLDDAVLEAGHKMLKQELWYLRFIERHPQQKVVGVDEIYLQSLDQMLVIAAIQNNVEHDGDLVAELYILRSLWAVARMGHLLHAAGEGKSGTIAMGYTHGKDLAVLAKRLGLESRIIVAIPKSVKMPEF